MITLSRAGSMRSSASTGLPAPQRPTTMLTSSLAELIPATVSVTVEDATWSFTPGSQFAANVTTGATGKAGYKDAGLFYTNIVITDANKDTVYFVTPYAKMGNTYYYGESRAACYTDAPTA